MTIGEGFRSFSKYSASALGSPWMFVANVFLIIVWLISGPFFHYSDTWQLIINTATTVFTYLAVFLIQNTQNRDATAIHLKLDELISSVHGARNRFVDLEELSDVELSELETQFKKLRQLTDKGAIDPVQAIVDDPGKVIGATTPDTKKTGVD